jgi:hypothetical protein
MILVDYNKAMLMYILFILLYHHFYDLTNFTIINLTRYR